MKFDWIQGLSAFEVRASRTKYGENALPPPEVETFWEKLFDNFNDPLIKILLVALLITLGLSVAGYADWIEALGIGIAVFLATTVSTFSEYKNEASFQELQLKASKINCNVFRNGNDLSQIAISEIVVDDYVLVQAGDKIPADGVLVAGEITVNQASLSGERESIKKRVAPKEFILAAEPTENDISGGYECYRGTVVDDGEGVLHVQRVGASTYFGKINKELNNNSDRESPLQTKLSNLADTISMIGYVGASFIALSFLFKQFIMDPGYSFSATIEHVKNWQLALHDVVNSLILSIIIVVVAVPEGLPMMIAIVLSLNMRKLLKANVLVRKLLGIETAGSLNLLFVDKTGTLTKGTFEPHCFVTGNMESFHSAQEMPKPLSDLFSKRESESMNLIRALSEEFPP